MKHLNLSCYTLSVCLGVLLLAGCGEGQPAAPQLPVPTAPIGSTSRPATAGADLYIANAGNSVTVYRANAHGNVTPIRTISGSTTGLNWPYGIALDTNKNIYVTNFDGNSVTVYTAGANGNVAPIRTISGSNTRLHFPEGMALDAIGNMYVVIPGIANGAVTVYAASANGNVAPIRTISGTRTDLIEPSSVALDASGEVYVANDTCFRGGHCVPDQVTVYAAGANGDVAPIRTITGPNTKLSDPSGIALDSNGNIYVTNFHQPSVTVYAAGANGNVAPIRTISGPNTRLKSPDGIALNAGGSVYAMNFPENGKPRDNRVTVYAEGASGNVRPIHIIHGLKTGLNGPFGGAVR